MRRIFFFLNKCGAAIAILGERDKKE